MAAFQEGRNTPSGPSPPRSIASIGPFFADEIGKFPVCPDPQSPGKSEEARVLWTIFVILLILWLLGFFAFHVTSSFIHLVLVIAVIFLILGLLRRGP